MRIVKQGAFRGKKTITKAIPDTSGNPTTEYTPPKGGWAYIYVTAMSRNTTGALQSVGVKNSRSGEIWSVAESGQTWSGKTMLLLDGDLFQVTGFATGGSVTYVVMEYV